jgi:hypothetical protein
MCGRWKIRFLLLLNGVALFVQSQIDPSWPLRDRRDPCPTSALAYWVVTTPWGQAG